MIMPARAEARQTWFSSLACLSRVRKPETRQRHAGETEAEFLQRRAARDGLGQAPGEFTRCDSATARRVEFIVHTVPFISVCR